jgi:hypothetical protein
MAAARPGSTAGRTAPRVAARNRKTASTSRPQAKLVPKVSGPAKFATPMTRLTASRGDRRQIACSAVWLHLTSIHGGSACIQTCLFRERIDPHPGSLPARERGQWHMPAPFRSNRRNLLAQAWLPAYEPASSAPFSKRSRLSDEMSIDDAWPFTISSAISSPTAGPSLNPCPLQPLQLM